MNHGAGRYPGRVREHPASAGQTGSVPGDLVNPALSMGPGGSYVDASYPLSR